MFKLKQYDWKKYNYSLVLLVLLLCIAGAYFIYLATGDMGTVRKQIQGVVLGLFLIAFLSVMDYHFICRFAIPLYILNVIMLMLVKYTPLGVRLLGATRWLNLGVVIQPSELTKITLIICFAVFFDKFKDSINKFTTIVMAVLVLIPPMFLIYKQPHLSTCIIIGLIFVSMVFMAGLSYKIIAPIIIVGTPSALLFVWYLCQPFQKLISDVQRSRLVGFFNRDEFQLGVNYQQNNSISAIGTGQLYGKIFSNMPNASRLSNVVTQNESDFIFSVIGEEFGFIGGCILIGIFAILIFKCLTIVSRAKDNLGKMLAFGITSMIMFQVFINIGVATAVLPNTGQPLPFVSNGLTTLICSMSSIGILLNISLQRKNTRG